MPRPSLDDIFVGTAKPVTLFRPKNEEERNAAIADVFSPQDNRPSLDQIFATQPPQAAVKPKVDKFDTVSDQGLQGATFGLGNRAQAGLAALVASGINDKPIAENYKAAREAGSARLKEEFEQNPGTSIAANLAGGLATGGIAAGTKAGTTVGNSLRTGGLLARAGKGSLAGAASGAAYGAGTAEYGKSGEGAVEGGILGGVVGAAAPVVGAALKSTVGSLKNIKYGATARTIEQLDEAASAIKQSSAASYKAMRDAGAVINKNRAANIANRVEGAIRSDGKLNASLHSNTLSVLDDFKKASRESDFTLEELDQWRQLFGEVAGNFNDKLNARKASIAIGAIDDAVNNLKGIDLKGGSTKAVDALKQGRAEWAKARKFEAVSEIVRKADGDPNRIKNLLKNFVDNPKKMRGFSPEETIALRKAAKNSAGESLLKSLGKFGFDLGSSRAAGNTALPIAASLIPGAQPLAIAGTAARQTQKYMGRAKLEDALRMIENGGSQMMLPRQPQSKNALIAAMLQGQLANLP